MRDDAEEIEAGPRQTLLEERVDRLYGLAGAICALRDEARWISDRVIGPQPEAGGTRPSDVSLPGQLDDALQFLGAAYESLGAHIRRLNKL